MPEDKNAEILDFLRARFARLDERFDRIDRKLDEVITRLGTLHSRLLGEIATPDDDRWR